MRYFVVPDLHGRGELAEGLLGAGDVPLDPDDRAAAGIRTVQLGDLANCVAADARRDTDLLQKALAWFDVVLVGNHEHPYFDGTPFSGFWRIPEVEEGIRALSLRGRLLPSYLVGDVLLTHAGVTPEWGLQTAEEAHAAISAAWKDDPTGPFFERIGRARGGWSEEGGILWSDFQEEQRAPFRQIHGHTPMLDGPFLRRANKTVGSWRRLPRRPLPEASSLNLDCYAKTGARAVGAWLDEAGEVELVGYAT